MAIIIKDYQWRQTEKKIIIYVPLRGHPKNVHLFMIDDYVKISFPPFILELFLWANVLEEESECTLTDTEAIFSLQKASVASDWPNLEVKDISEEQKRDSRKRALEKAQNISDNRAKSKSEKRQYLQKEAVKVQINVDTDTLNKIEALRDSHRRAAMQDFEEWRSNAELPIFQDISGKVQENRKAYRAPLKWFKDDLGILRSREIDKKEKLNEELKEIKEKQQDSIVIEELIVEENLEEPSSIEGNLKKELIVEEDTKKELIIVDNLKENSINGKELKKELNIKEKVEEELTIVENLNTELIKANLKEDTVLNENIQKEGNTLEIKEAILSKNSDLQEQFSSYSEDSESDYEMISSKSATKSLMKKMDQKSSQRFYVKTKKQKPDQNLIDKVLNGQYSKMNQIFDESENAVPLPRKSGTINITFSERVFPTPARESSFIEEQEWLSKQAEARRKTGFVVEDLRPEEQDPQWLKDKGDDFFKAGNYLAAISAYTHGIKISNEMTALYVNRSAAHYALGNYYRCIDDCSKVLELMEPKCESNRVSRARCHARRGAALCKLSAPQHGIPELEAALKLDPNNDSIKHDLFAVKQYFNIKE
ncbi:dynein axonemal assembly factor 4-like [Cataglyphis hispanica]|uniref:dynein axonemal assembly factor 4-like n=1 Tax=Cataglyphis hispanica TaxID=1086592 RepID=UPI00217F8128|nr:dynein axonemal assembly factor 4-like [Cataglyphis hispanica]